MTWDAIGAIGETLGAIGVIVSLIYLALQIRRSDQTARTQSMQALWDGCRDRLLGPASVNPQLNDVIAKGLSNFVVLTDSDKRQFFWFFFEQCFQAQQAMDLHDRSLIPSDHYDAWMRYVATLMQTPGGKQAWPYIENTLAPSTQEKLRNWLAANPDTRSWIELNPFFKHE